MQKLFVLSLVSAGLLIGAACPAFAQNPEEKPADPFEKAASMADVQAVLDAMMQEIESTIEAGASPVEQRALLIRAGKFNLAAAGKMLDGLAKNDKETETALRTKILGLKLMTNETATRAETVKELQTLVQDIEKEGKFPAIINDERFLYFVNRVEMALTRKLNRESFDALVEEAKGFANRQPRTYAMADVFLSVVGLGERAKTVGLLPDFDGGVLVRSLIEFVKSPECTVPEEDKEKTIEILGGYCRRCKGAELDLYGKTIDGKDFDWASYRGKYVLVKFTASWCGPCKMEIPGIKRAYEKYREKGFDVVSVGVQDLNENLLKFQETERFPWTMLSEDLTAKAGMPKQGDLYVVEGIPVILLVDKDGKVLEENLRGPALQKKLAELFPESR